MTHPAPTTPTHPATRPDALARPDDILRAVRTALTAPAPAPSGPGSVAPSVSAPSGPGSAAPSVSAPLPVPGVPDPEPGAGTRVEAVGVRRVSAGASRHTFLVDVVARGERERLVVQAERRGGLGGGVGVAEQVALLRSVRGAGVPVAQVVAFDPDGRGVLDGDDAPFVVSRFVDGVTLPRAVLRDPALAAARAGFARDCGTVLAALHRTPLDGLPPLDAGDQLDRVVAWIDRVGDPVPAFELAIRWLRAHRPEPVPAVLVHGDFRLGNLIIGPTGVNAVLDWEMTHLGDPAEDLAWLTLRAWRFRGPREVGGMGEVTDLLDAYAAAGGTPPDAGRLHWWRVLGTLRWGSICQRQARTHLDGHTRSVELAAIGRRVCETEHDILELLP